MIITQETIIIHPVTFSFVAHQTIENHPGVSSAATHLDYTNPENAHPQHFQTALHATYKNARRLVTDVTGTEGLTASPGMVVLDAIVAQVVRKENTGVRSADQSLTARNHATPSEFLPIVTPFIPDAWEHVLRANNLFNDFHDVPFSLRYGFDMGVHTFPEKTYTPPNHTSALTHPDAIMSHITKELSLGRYTGPFSQSRLEHLIGPFRTSPLGVVPKAGTLNEF